MFKPGQKSGYYLLILTISLAIFVAALDTFIVNIALPTISESFHLSSSDVSWVTTIYMLVMAGCVLIFGKVSDVIGFKRVYITGFVIFIVGSLMCGVLPDLTGSFWTLVGSRAFQAIGGAMITAVPLAMVTAYIPLEMKGKAMGIVVTMTSIGAAIGPSLGGILTEYLSWQWIFYINVPIGIIAIILGTWVIPGSVRKSMDHGFDRAGAVFIFAGLALLLYGLSEGGTIGWDSPVIIGSLLAAVIILGLFIRQEFLSVDPLLQLLLFRDRNFLFFNLAFSLLLFSVSGIIYFMPFFMRYVGEYSTSSSGLILSSFSFFTMVAGLIAGMLYNRVGGRNLLIWAACIVAFGYFLFITLNADASTGYIFLVLSIAGFGGGLFVPPLSNMVMTMVSRQYQGMVSSLLMIERFAPLTLGVAFFNFIFVQGKALFSDLLNVIPSSSAALQLKVLTAGYDITFLSVFLIGIVVIILTWFAHYTIHPDYLEKDDENLAAGTS